MAKTQSIIITVDVWFIVDTSSGEGSYSFYFDGDVTSSEDPRIGIPPGSQLVAFHLRTSQNPEDTSPEQLKEHEVLNPVLRANFTSSPLQWVDNSGAPMNTPAVFTVGRVSGRKTNIFACNTLTEDDGEEIYPLRLIAMYEGEIYWSPDPTLINLPENP